MSVLKYVFRRVPDAPLALMRAHLCDALDCPFARRKERKWERGK